MDAVWTRDDWTDVIWAASVHHKTFPAYETSLELLIPSESYPCCFASVTFCYISNVCTRNDGVRGRGVNFPYLQNNVDDRPMV